MFWAHASNTARLEQSFREIADQAKVPGRRGLQADVFKLVHDWLRNEKNGRWLLVLDNADDAAVLSPNDSNSSFRQHLSRYLPSSKHGSVLVTSRTRCAAAYIRERAPRYSVRQYLEEYHQSDSKKKSLLIREAGYHRRDEKASNAVLVTWQVSFDHLRSARYATACLLSLMSFFDRQGIQESLLCQHSSAADKYDGFEDDVLALRDYSFITVTKDASTFEMHSLVQLATRTWLEREGQLDQWRKRFIFNLCAELLLGE